MFSPFRVQATMIAKKHGISMFLCTEKTIEIAELDDYKALQFIRAIERLNPKTRVTDLIKNKQHIDTNGYDITGDKSLYLVDDEYYRKVTGDNSYSNNIVGEVKIGQISMFQ